MISNCPAGELRHRACAGKLKRVKRVQQSNHGAGVTRQSGGSWRSILPPLKSTVQFLSASDLRTCTAVAHLRSMHALEINAHVIHVESTVGYLLSFFAGITTDTIGLHALVAAASRLLLRIVCVGRFSLLPHSPACRPPFSSSNRTCV